jgi:REP element-mobilizing transposase RayT
MLCDQCHWHKNEKPLKGCDFCIRLGFPEDILCSFVRNNCEDKGLLECKAYRPKLSLTSSRQQSSAIIKGEETNHNILTDKDKYFIALSKQKLKSNEDEVYFSLQFHVCLITKKRNMVFSNENDFIEEIANIFKNIEASFKDTQIEVLHVHSDHIHLYVNTTPDYAFDDIADKIISISEKEIFTTFPKIINQFNSIWETGYFAETIG